MVGIKQFFSTEMAFWVDEIVKDFFLSNTHGEEIGAFSCTALFSLLYDMLNNTVITLRSGQICAIISNKDILLSKYPSFNVIIVFIQIKLSPFFCYNFKATSNCCICLWYHL